MSAVWKCKKSCGNDLPSPVRLTCVSAGPPPSCGGIVSARAKPACTTTKKATQCAEAST